MNETTASWIRLSAFVLALVARPCLSQGAQVIETLPAGDWSAPDLAWDGALLWASGQHMPVQARDPVTGQILREFRGSLPHVYSRPIAWDGRHLWIAALGVSDLYVVDPVSGRIESTLRVRWPGGSHGVILGLEWKDGELWLVDSPGAPLNLVARVDPHDGSILASASWPQRDGFADLAWDGSAFYTLSVSGLGRSVLRIDPHTGQTLASFPAPGPSSSGLAWDGHYLWGASGDSLYKVDPQGQPHEVLTISQVLRSPRYRGRGKDVDWHDRQLWYTEIYGDSIYQIDPGPPMRVKPFVSLDFHTRESANTRRS